MGVAALLLLNSAAAFADIRDTPHGFIRAEGKGAKVDAREICVFCHTPAIGADGAVRQRAPTWQASISKDFVFTIYDDIGRLGLDKPSIGSQSIACLSCHDANQALAVSRTSADHPFGVPYRGSIKGRRLPGDEGSGRTDGTAVSPHRHARYLVALDDFRDVSRGVIENRTVWWVSSSGVTARRNRNDLPLYSRIDHESGEELPHIECSSCHDPHSPNAQFLRVRNDGSALCLTCHNK